MRPFPNVDAGNVQVSTGGGTRPLWARSGNELFYLTGTSPAPVSVMAVSIQAGNTFTAGNPRKLIEGPFFAASSNFARSYDVSPDGKRFLLIKEQGRPVEESGPSSLVVVLNWFDELKRLAPPKK